MLPGVVSLPHLTTDDPVAARFVRVSLFVLFTYVFLANAWMGDDAYITFRAAWNLVHGFGFTFNPSERVQAFTNPLWGLVVAGANLLTREFFFTVTALSWAFSLAAGSRLLSMVRTWPTGVLLAGWLLSSKALIDYSSSGLEYPLSYFLLALFYTRYLARDDASAPVGEREVATYVFIASLAFVNRADAILLFAFPLAELTWRALRIHRWKAVPRLLVAGCPAVGWLLFATFYYGFPLPKTYYAKVANGIPSFLLGAQGVAYLLNSLRFDPITLSTIALASAVGWRQGGPRRWAACTIAVSVFYSVSVGGDFMGGRFFALPFLVAAAVLARSMPTSLAAPAAGALVLYNLLVPVAPIKTTPGHQAAWAWRTQNGIKDEMGISHPNSNVLAYAPLRPFPDTPFAREGLSFSASDGRAVIYCCIGMYGFNAGPAKHVIDNNALSDPLLARLPVSLMVYFDFWASHYFRDLPEGYLESNEHDRNLLADPLLHDYYDKLRNVTRGSLWRWSRLRDIWELNLGQSRRIGEKFEKRRPVVLSVRASHDRFLTDIGERDTNTGTLRTSGRRGYLQLGPGIPMKAGSYRVQWKGRAEAAEGSPLGQVEVWNGPKLVTRTPVVANADEVLAKVNFTLQEPARHLEYRFWVNGAAGVTLQRIELLSSSAVMPER